MAIFRAFPGRDGNPVLCPLPRSFFIRVTLLMFERFLFVSVRNGPT